jgi:hypothetical protein
MGLPHKMFLLESYFRSGRLENGQHVYSINQWIQEFRQQFPNLVTTYTQLVKYIYACVDKFRETGSVNRKPGSRAPRKRAADSITDIQRRMENSPKKAIVKLTQEVQLSVGTCHTILKKDLQLCAYKIQAVHKVRPFEFGRRTAYFQLENLNSNDILDKCFFSNEAWFHLSGYK